MWFDLGPIEDHYQDPDYDYYNENYPHWWRDRDDEEYEEEEDDYWDDD